MIVKNAAAEQRLKQFRRDLKQQRQTIAGLLDVLKETRIYLLQFARYPAEKYERQLLERIERITARRR